MQDNVSSVVARFVDLVDRHNVDDGEWGQNGLGEEEVQVLFDMVALVGFKPAAVVPGVIQSDERGLRSVFHEVNQTCPYKVRAAHGDDYIATGWLDQILCRTIPRSFSPQSREQRISAVASLIEKTMAPEPIKITAEGDFFGEKWAPKPDMHADYLAPRARDADELEQGRHIVCGGDVEVRQTTASHQVLLCRSCGLRVLISLEVKTYGDLRRMFADI